MTNNTPDYRSHTYTEAEITALDQPKPIVTDPIPLGPINPPAPDDPPEERLSLDSYVTQVVLITSLILSSDGTDSMWDICTAACAAAITALPDALPDADVDITNSDDVEAAASIWSNMPADMSVWFDEPRYSECFDDDATSNNEGK